MTDNLLVHAYVDGELDPAHALELEGAIAANAALAAERDRVQALCDLIRDRLAREREATTLDRRCDRRIGRGGFARDLPGG